MRLNKKLNLIIFFSVFTFVFLFTTRVYGVDLTSSSFIIRDPVIGTGGEFGTSASFQLFGAGDTLLIGNGSSATYIGRYGFLYYPFVEAGTLTAVQNGADADLSWVASEAGLGWTVAGYNTGKATVSGGPYSYTSVGNVTDYTYELLDPGYYCFVVQTLDSLGYVIATSNEDCITIVPVISLDISDNNLTFGNLSTSSARYADTSTGSDTDTVAHTITLSSNAPSGYVLTYYGSTLTSGANTIDVASSVSGDGTQGVEQFGLSLSTSGSATIPSAYDQAGPTRTFVHNSATTIASTTTPSDPEVLSLHYLANISPITESGEYSTNITYILTGTF